MSQKRKHDESRPAQEDSTSDEHNSSDVESRDEKRRPESTEKVLEITDDVLADIDDALKEALGADEKNVDKLADEFVKGYIQKGGQ
ncbi:hypothetical protein [Actinoallomurus sp. NPDC050550]|uniref:hypothetical protein n=1 Tax=Actinoallomurus sp. NPDC050550 TaxID=3154937 RepID=UPI0033D2388F